MYFEGGVNAAYSFSRRDQRIWSSDLSYGSSVSIHSQCFSLTITKRDLPSLISAQSLPILRSSSASFHRSVEAGSEKEAFLHSDKVTQPEIDPELAADSSQSVSGGVKKDKCGRFDNPTGSAPYRRLAPFILKRGVRSQESELTVNNLQNWLISQNGETTSTCKAL